MGNKASKEENGRSHEKTGNSTSKSNNYSDEMDSNSLKSTASSDSEEDSAMKRDKSLRYHNNGVEFVEKVKRSELRLQFPPKSKNVIGVDFGTSTIAVCYVTSASDTVYQFKIQEEDTDYSTPTVLLIDQDNKVEIGIRALRRYTRLGVDVNNSIFFDKIKLELQHDKVNI